MLLAGARHLNVGTVTGGTEWIVDAFGCAPDRLRDRARLVALLDAVVASLGLTVIGAPHVHVFPGPGGVTALYVLSESHLACHTFPEFGSACLDLFTCHPVRPWPFKEGICRALSAREVRIRSLRRRYRALESKAP